MYSMTHPRLSSKNFTYYEEAQSTDKPIRSRRYIILSCGGEIDNSFFHFTERQFQGLKRGCMREWTFWGPDVTWPTPILTKTGTVVGNDPKTSPQKVHSLMHPLLKPHHRLYKICFHPVICLMIQHKSPN